MKTMFTISKAPGDPDYTSYGTREEALQGIRELFEAGLAERGEFYVVEQNDAGEVIRIFDVDDAHGTVTKQEFVSRVAKKAGLSQRDAAKAVDAFLDSVTDALKSGDSVTFTGFGKFTTAHRKPREGANPRNPAQKVHIPAASVPKFAAGSGLKEAVKRRGS